MDDVLSQHALNQLRTELQQLDTTLIDIDGIRLRPSQCYRFETDPVHVLFNTNCPDSLKSKVEAILTKYTRYNESRS